MEGGGFAATFYCLIGNFVEIVLVSKNAPRGSHCGGACRKRHSLFKKRLCKGPAPGLPEKEVIMTEIMRKESNLNTMEGRSFTELIPEFLIAIDHGWSSIKTPSIIFENGITELQTMPATKDNLLEFRGRKYVIGQGRMGKQETKTENENYYLLTLAAIAKELRKRTGAKVVKVNLAVGVPLTLYGKEKKEFKNYLRANDKVSFYYEGDRYVVHFGKVRVFAQCHAAIANRMEGMDRLTAVDCGSWTLDIMSVVNKVPVLDECHTYQQGLITAIDRIQKECIAKYGKEVPEYIINEVIETGDTNAIAKNKESIMDTINAGLKRYALEVEAKLRELKIDFDFTNVVYVGGGAGVMRRFGSCTGENVRYVTDVRANALGYQYLAQNLEV